MKFSNPSLPYFVIAIAIVGCSNSESAASNVVQNIASDNSAANSEPTPAPTHAESNSAPEAAEPTPQPPAVKLPKQTFEISEKGTAGWSKATSTAAQVAKAVDTKIAGLKNFMVTSKLSIKLGSGEGVSNVRSVVRDRKNYRHEWTRLGGEVPMTRMIARAKNGQILIFGDGGWKPGQLNVAPTTLADIQNQFNGHLLDPLLTQKPVLSTLVQAAQKAKWNVTVEKKKFGNKGNTRLLLAEKSGDRVVEVVIDDAYGLPVTIRSVLPGKDKKLVQQRWVAEWAFKKTAISEGELEAPYVPQD